MAGFFDNTSLARSGSAPEADEPPAPLAGTRAEAMQRLQVGIAGVAAVILLVGLASTILQRARETEANTVPEAAATVSPAPKPQSDPLSDAGIVPDLPPEPEETQTGSAPVLPEQGT